MTNNYKIIGGSRQIGAIGIFEPFIFIVNADTSKQAYDSIRQSLYNNNREHVSIKSIHLLTDNGAILIEPNAYLY